ncbi:hypothetical protein RRG08_020403 [Elysia crispata]|uniref:Uncharacterized protein n=1 Tax=Elysia crispata TaxID=231223 RepID=A0AAE1B523_9GAST|nr:hypothetical protein RRG08_020403 [Elysia crispata]
MTQKGVQSLTNLGVEERRKTDCEKRKRCSQPGGFAFRPCLATSEDWENLGVSESDTGTHRNSWGGCLSQVND